MYLDPASPFPRFLLSEAEEKIAVQVSTLTYIYIQNKLSKIAEEMTNIEFTDPKPDDPRTLQDKIREHILLRGQREALELLLADFKSADSQPTSAPAGN